MSLEMSCRKSQPAALTGKAQPFPKGKRASDQTHTDGDKSESSLETLTVREAQQVYSDMIV